MNYKDDITRISKADALHDFRMNMRPAVDAKELMRLRAECFSQPSQFQQEIAEVYFEKKCMESWIAFCKDLYQAGYRKVYVGGEMARGIDIFAGPKQDYPILWSLCDKYFPCSNSRGSDAQFDRQEVTIRFPKSLLGKTHCLCDKCMESIDAE